MCLIVKMEHSVLGFVILLRSGLYRTRCQEYREGGGWEVIRGNLFQAWETFM